MAARNVTLDLLRGFAALAVCWFHFTHGNRQFLADGLLRSSGTYGWLGVNIFFVISGFIIPFALHRAQYGVADYGSFLLKRVVRLDPPYFCAIGIVILLAYLSAATPGFAGEKLEISTGQVLAHAGYLNAFLGFRWLNPVFWTLAIEAQYYLLIGLAYPLLMWARGWWSFSLLPLGAMAFLFPASWFICYWLLLFLFGISTFQFKSRLISLPMYLIWLAVLSILSAFAYGFAISAAGILTACAIAFFEIQRAPAWLLYFGHISYSLYLLHVPIGGRLVNLGNRLGPALSIKIVTLVSAVVGSIVAAALLHHFVERPAQRWSSMIGYKKGKVAPSGFAPREG